jgi:hypothetical protein
MANAQLGIKLRLELGIRERVSISPRPSLSDHDWIGEALGIEIDKHISSDFSTINIRQKARHCRIEKRLKTPSAERDVDLHPAIARLLENYVGLRKSPGFHAKRKPGFLLHYPA